MPAVGKRRRGKQAAARSTASASNRSSITSVNNALSTTTAATNSNSTVPTTSLTTFTKDSSNENTAAVVNNTNSNNQIDVCTADKNSESVNYDLILTSEKRRGVFECDYCQSDISQLPRVRCAVCVDFDLCLDCFATTDHALAIQRMRAAASAHDALIHQGIGAGTEGTYNASSTGISSAAIHHDDSHGYRVCDSTRFPLFSNSTKCVSTALPSNTTATITTTTTTNKTVNEQKDDNNEQEGTKMDIDKLQEQDDEEEWNPAVDEHTGAIVTNTATKAVAPDDSTTSDNVIIVQAGDDPKNMWTAEEDLRLLEGIRAHGLGNWNDISEAVSGHGSVGKTPKRCMERYFDGFLGRYGHILPMYTLVREDDEANTPAAADDGLDSEKMNPAAAAATPDKKPEEEETVRTSKRRAAMLRSPNSSSALNAMSSKKKYRAVLTTSLPEYENLWPEPYVPQIEGVQMGQEVDREATYKAEQAFVKAISSTPTKEEADKIRKEWETTRLNKPGGPTVLPMRVEDIATMPGSELVGFMPRRGDFDVEWENDAEQIIADMEFLPGESAQDKQLKLQVLGIYNSKLDERERRKKFVISRGLYDYRKHRLSDQRLTRDERDLVHRMRLFERFHTPDEHQHFISDLLKAKRLRKEIAKLQMYRRMGIRTLAEAEKYELDKRRRIFHKSASTSRDESKRSDGMSSSPMSGDANRAEEASSSSLLWKQYRTSDRRVRKSINRGEQPTQPLAPASAATTTTTAVVDSSEKVQANSADNPQADPVTTTTQSPVDDNNKETTDAAMDVEMEDREDKQQTAVPASAAVAEAVVTAEPRPAAPISAEQSAEAKQNKEQQQQLEDDISNLPGYNLLSTKEVELCKTLQLVPSQYIEVRSAILVESLKEGLLDKESSNRRTFVMIDAEKRGKVVDFMVRAGWITTATTPAKVSSSASASACTVK